MVVYNYNGMKSDGLILRGDTPLLWQFDGGYVDLDANGAATRWNYYVTDHLGSTRMVVDSNDSIREVINYYPFGSEMRMEAPAQMTSDTSHPFRFTGKELDRQNGLNMYDFGARLFDVAGVPMWTSVDPLAEKYYPFTPYSYCAGDPVNKFDPDGREVIIWYKNVNGGYKSFAFSGWHGKKTINIPNNQFVKDFIAAYKYNTQNGGGKNMIKAITNPKYSINIYDGTDPNLSSNGTPLKTNYFTQNGKQFVSWESRHGLKVSSGGSQSPATRLEHEIDHAVDEIDNPTNHRDRRETADNQFDNEEERRVITGSEKETAEANSESIRDDHKGSSFKVHSPTSNF